MKILRELLNENGATTSANVAGARSLLFTSPIKRKPFAGTLNKIKVIKFNRVANWNIRESFLRNVVESFEKDSKFNSLDVVSKMDYAEKDHDLNRNSVVFGLEDDDGNTVKVYIDKEQAGEFEQALQRELSHGDKKKEIAEILFELKDKFKINHVDWPAIPEDEEVNTKLETDDKAKSDEAIDMDDQLKVDGDKDDKEKKKDDLELPPPEEIDDSGESDQSSMLNKVIDMLKSEAEARKAEAHAKAKEAQAKEAEYASKIAHQKVRSEEEILNAENYFKQQAEEKKEARRLITLAKYKHEMARDEHEDAE